MGRGILIVGAGQSGLQLALGLLKHGYDVTVMSANDPEEIFRGTVRSTQCMFGPALGLERELELDHWGDSAPKIVGLDLTVAGPDGSPALDWAGTLEDYAQSVDQRVKMASWLDLVEQRGGRVILHGVTTSDLPKFSTMYDLVVIAAGKSELTELFDVDEQWSPFTSPQRKLALAYVNGAQPRHSTPDAPVVGFNAVPGVGEFISIPALTITGPCDILFFEGVPGGPLDCWGDRPKPHEMLDRMLALMRQFVPWEYERCGKVELTDAGGTLAGAYAPVVRKPVAHLPGGGQVWGMADVVVRNDPVTAQGANTAAKCASAYLDAIVAHGDRPYDENFMNAAFGAFWERHGRPVTMFTTAMLGPLPEHFGQVLGAAQHFAEVRSRFVNGVADPGRFGDWLFDPAKTAAYLAGVTGAMEEVG